MEYYRLEVRHIVKRFPGVLALDDVSVSFDSGHIHAIIGKNGSGKSTLMKIVSGVLSQNSGDVYLYGQKIEHNSAIQALENGICTVYQELSLVNDLMVSENIFLGRLPLKGKIGIDWPQVHEKARMVLDELGVQIDVRMYVGQLSIGQKQLVEIAKAMSFAPKVLILDEPTSALSETECEKLFTVLRGLREKGIIILFISHRLQELYKVADYVTVLRDGILIGTEKIADLAPKDIVNMMFGDVEHKAKPASFVRNETILEVKGLTAKKFKNIDLILNKGEVLGIAGMMGAGRTELLRAIFGIDRFDSGEIIVRGQAVRQKDINPCQMKKLGFAYTSENRKEDGLCLNLSVGDNLCMASLYDISPRKRISKTLARAYIEKQIKGLSIKVSGHDDMVYALSGGNQQKIVIGNWLNTKPKIIFLDEPSRGIDVSAKQQIFSIIWKEAEKGVSFIVVSSELEELIEVCDRIIIMRHGEFKGAYNASELTVEEIYSKCMEGE